MAGDGGEVGGVEVQRRFAVPVAATACRAACSQQHRQYPFFSGSVRRQYAHGPGLWRVKS
jgi:hypothetical protein